MTGVEQPANLTLLGDNRNFGGHNGPVARWTYYLRNLDPWLARDAHFFVWDWRPTHISFITTAFPWDQYFSCISAHSGKVIVVIDSAQEGMDYKNHLKPLCDRLVELGHPVSHILLWGNIQEDSDTPVGWIDSDGGLDIGMHPLSDHRYDVITSHHFVMLARQPKPLRLMMASRLLSSGLDAFGYISCGSILTDLPWKTWYGEFIDQSVAHRFPILLDGYIEQYSRLQYSVNDPRISQAAINVICETSQDNSLMEDMWHKPWLTEKTTKAFFLCQLPLIVGVAGTVQKIRDLDIDVFDDIIDHGYDTEPDPRIRIDMVTDQLAAICAKHKPHELRSIFWDRLMHNRDLMFEKISNIQIIQKHRLSIWLKTLRVSEE